MEREPDVPEFRLRLGTGLLGAGAIAEAIIHLERAVELAPDNVEARRALALAFHRGEELRRAVEEYQAAIALAPGDESLYLGLAEVLRTGKLPDEAAALLADVRKLFPASRRVLSMLAESQFEAGRVEAALESYTAASRLDAPGLLPEADRLERSAIYENIGDMQVQLIRFDDALSAYREALTLDSDNLDARVSMALLYTRRGRYEEALEVYRQILEADPASVAAWHGLAEANLRLGRPAASIAAAESAIRLDPEHLAAHYVRARALILSGQAAEGRRELARYRAMEEDRRARELREREIGSFYKNALSQLVAGDAEAAIRLFEEGLERYPDARDLHWNLGLVRMDLDRFEEAVRTFQNMVELGLDDAGVHRSLASAYLELGNVEASERHRAIFLERSGLDLRR